MYQKKIADIALGKEKAGLVLKNANVIQVLTNEILTADIAIEDGVIAGVGVYDGIKEIDMTGKYVSPGFIDSHLHLESTLVNPAELIHCASRQGTTAFVVDPHEAANVSGLNGIDFILDETKDAKANVYVMVPSCVPAAEFEDNGFKLTAKEMEPYLKNERILGLGEVMDSKAVLNADEIMLEKLRMFQENGKIIDGHAGFLGEHETNCYVLSGIQTDHECRSYEDALREMRAGLWVLVREGTAAKNLEGILSGVIKNHNSVERLAFCTDDKHIEEINANGHISNNVRRAIELGLSPIEAIKIATYNAAQCYGLKKQGAIAPGYEANLVVLSDLEKVAVEEVFYKGSRIEEELIRKEREIPEELLQTVHVKIESSKEFALSMEKPFANVMEVIPGEILTRKKYEQVAVKDGFFTADESYQKIAVLERHKGSGKIGIGIVKGFHVCGGAIASSVGHDSHNIIVIGDDDEDMFRAVKELERTGGGYTIVQHEKEPETLPLEIMGLISREDYKTVNQKSARMLALAHEMGVPDGIDPFITLSFLSLPVIPSLRITARGIYDVEQGRFIGISE